MSFYKEEIMSYLIEFYEIGIIGSIKSIYGIAVIVIPLMIFMEIAKDLKILDGVSKLFSPISKFLGMSNRSAFPLAVGLFFGISYGAGVLIQSMNEDELDTKSVLLVSIFLAACHAIVEDTLLFVAVGASGIIIVSVRLISAFFLTYFSSLYMTKKKM